VIASAEKAEADKALGQEAENRAALEAEIRKLNERIETLNRDVAQSERERERLVRESQAATAAAEAERRRADTAAAARQEAMSVAPSRGHYVNTTELTGGFGLGDTDPDFTGSIFGVTNVFGYAFTERLTGGVGTGVYFYNGGTMMPLYLDFRYRFNGMTFRPIIVADGGMLFDISNFGSSAVFINPSFGVERQLGPRSALHMSLGPLVQHGPARIRSTFIVARAGISFSPR
jgi:hypothetical protein